MMNCQNLISLIKEYFTLIEIAALSPVSKIWRDAKSYSSKIIIINPTKKILSGAIRHINKSTIKHIYINRREHSMKYTLSGNDVSDFITNLSNAGVKLCSINFYKSTYMYHDSNDLSINGFSNPNIYFPVIDDFKCVESSMERPQTYDDTKKVIINYCHRMHSHECFYNNKLILTIRYLFFDGTNIGLHCSTSNELIKSLTLSKLKYLSLFGYSNEDTNGYVASIEYLHNINSTNLKTLNLHACNMLTLNAVKSIIDGFQNTFLEHFIIDGCINITDNDIEQIVLAIKQSKLKYFEMSWNYDITNILLDPKKLSKTLCYLNISHYNMTNIDFKLLMESLSETQIMSINISHSRRDVIIPCLMKELKGTNIHHLNLSESSLSDFNVQSLIKTLSNNNINSFDLSGTTIALNDKNMPFILKIINNNRQ